MPIRFLIACVLVILIGCGTQPSSSNSAASGDETQYAAVLSELTQTVRKFAAEQRRAPKGLEDLLAGGYLNKVPPAPSGKKFVIDKNLQVILANQ